MIGCLFRNGRSPQSRMAACTVTISDQPFFRIHLLKNVFSYIYKAKRVDIIFLRVDIIFLMRQSLHRPVCLTPPILPPLRKLRPALLHSFYPAKQNLKTSLSIAVNRPTPSILFSTAVLPSPTPASLGVQPLRRTPCASTLSQAEVGEGGLWMGL